MIQVGIIGATGYTGFEILKILLTHDSCKVAWLTARQIESPVPIAKIFPQVLKVTDLICQNEIDVDAISKTCDLVFLSLPHRVSMNWAEKFLAKGVKVIDLSADFRLKDIDIYEKWYGQQHVAKESLKSAVYGLPEFNYGHIKKANLIANPGCYPTSILLGLLPLLQSDYVDKNARIICDSKSGVSGAGKNPFAGSHFPECNENMKAYKVFKHQHQPEIEQIASEMAQEKISCLMVPHLVPINRGILSTIYVQLKCPKNTEDLVNAFKAFYKEKPFVRVLDMGDLPEIKNVVNTNFCDISVLVKEDLAVVVCAIDNLLKGAAGQAVQNMNIMFGFDETKGLL